MTYQKIITSRRFRTLDNWEVAAGWDGLLRSFYLIIARDCPDCYPNKQHCNTCNTQGYLFAYTDQDDPEVEGDMNYGQLAEALSKMLTELPVGFLEVLENDQLNNVEHKSFIFPVTGEVNLHAAY
jgi:hypothetical protein